MLIQLENNTILDPERFIITPNEHRDGIDSYNILTVDLRLVTTISPREAEVILLLVATYDDIKTSHPVLRIREWSVFDGRLNYRFAAIYKEKLQPGETIVEHLKGAVEAALQNNDAKIEIINTLTNLARDKDFTDIQDREKLFNSLTAFHLGTSQKLQSLLDDWDDIFIDLPF